MAVEQILILKLLTDLKQPVQSFGELETRVKTLRKVLKNTPNEGTKAFDKLALEISGKLNVDLDAAKNKIREFGNIATKEVQEGTVALKEYRSTLRTVDAPKGSINAMRQAVKGLAKEVDNLDTKTAKFTRKNAELKKMNQTLIAIEKSTLRGGRNVGNYETAFRRFGGILTGVAASLGVGFGIAGLSRGVGAAGRVFADFNQQIAILRSISRSTKQEIKPLEDEIKRLGESTQFTAKQAALAATTLARSGQKNEQILQTLEPVLNGAIATGRAIEEVANITAVALKSLNIPVSESAAFVDQLTETLNTSNQELQDYQEAFKLLAPSARVLGVDLADVNTTIGLLADGGLKGSIATTTLRRGLNRLADDSKKYAKVAKRLGVDTFDANGEFVGMAQLLKNLEKAFESYTPKARTAALTQIFGAQASDQFNILLNGQKELLVDGEKQVLKGAAAFEQYAKQIRGAEGAAANASAIVGDTLTQDVLKLRSALEGAAIRFGEFSNGGTREFVQFLTKSIPLLADNAGLILRVAAGLALFIVRARTGAALIAAYSAPTRALAAAQLLYANATRLLASRISFARKMQLLFNKATKANLIGLAVTAIFAIVSAYKQFSKQLSITEKVQKRVNAAQLESQKATAREKNDLELLLIVAKDETRTKQDRLEAVKRLNDISPEYLGNLTLENIETKKGIEAIDNYIRSLDRKALAQALAGQRQKLHDKLVAAEASSLEKNISNWDKAGAALTSFGNRQLFVNNIARKSISNREEAISGINDEIKAFDELVKQKLRNNEIGLGDLIGDQPNPNTGSGDPDFNKKKGDEHLTYLENLQKEQKQLADEIKNLIAENQPYATQLDLFLSKTEELTQINNEYNLAIKKVGKVTKDYVDGSLKDYSVRIGTLQESQKKINISSEEYGDIQEKILGIEKERALALELVETRTEAYRKSISDLNAQFGEGQAELSLTDGALEQIRNITDAGQEGRDQIKKIQEQLAADLEALEKDRLRSTLAAIDEEISAINSAEKIELANAGNNEQKKIDIVRKFAKERAELQLDGLEVNVELRKRELADFEASEKKKTDALKKQEAKRKELRDAGFEVANELNSAIFDILGNREQQEFDRLNADLDREEERALRTAELVGSSEEQQASIRRRFALERDRLERDQARKDKRRALLQAAINTAVAITKSLPNFIQAGLVAALGAIQIATISSQQFALGGLFAKQVQSGSHPSFGKGAYLSQGAYHSQGGMPIINPHTGRKVAEIEKDEGIINRRSMRSKDVLRLEGTPYEIASMINSYKGYGRAYPKRSRPSIGSRPSLRNIKKHKFSQGGRFGVSSKVMKMSSGAVFSNDIKNEAILIKTDDDQKKLTMVLIEEVRELRASNAKGLGSIPSTADELKQVKQFAIDEQNAS